MRAQVFAELLKSRRRVKLVKIGASLVQQRREKAEYERNAPKKKKKKNTLASISSYYAHTHLKKKKTNHSYRLFTSSV